jgi:RhoGEF domain
MCMAGFKKKFKSKFFKKHSKKKDKPIHQRAFKSHARGDFRGAEAYSDASYSPYLLDFAKTPIERLGIAVDAVENNLSGALKKAENSPIYDLVAETVFDCSLHILEDVIPKTPTNMVVVDNNEAAKLSRPLDELANNEITYNYQLKVFANMLDKLAVKHPDDAEQINQLKANLTDLITNSDKLLANLSDVLKNDDPQEKLQAFTQGMEPALLQQTILDCGSYGANWTENLSSYNQLIASGIDEKEVNAMNVLAAKEVRASFDYPISNSVYSSTKDLGFKNLGAAPFQRAMRYELTTKEVIKQAKGGLADEASQYLDELVGFTKVATKAAQCFVDHKNVLDHRKEVQQEEQQNLSMK